MEAVRTYFVSIVAVCMISVLATVLVHDPKLKKIVRFVGGILILLVVAKPLMSLDGESLVRSIQRAEGSFAFDSSKIAQQSNQMLKELIKENTETYIEDKARELGAAVQAEVEVHDGEYPEPYSVTLIGTLNPVQAQQLQAYITDALGIAAEHQEWKLYG